MSGQKNLESLKTLSDLGSAKECLMMRPFGRKSEASGQKNTKSNCGECGKATKSGYGRGEKFRCDDCHENQIRRETREVYNQNLPVDKSVSVKFRKFKVKGLSRDSSGRN